MRVAVHGEVLGGAIWRGVGRTSSRCTVKTGIDRRRMRCTSKNRYRQAPNAVHKQKQVSTGAECGSTPILGIAAVQT